MLERCRAALESGTPLRALQLESDADKCLRGFQLLSAKPLLVVVNLGRIRSDACRAGRRHGGLHGIPLGRGRTCGPGLRED